MALGSEDTMALLPVLKEDHLLQLVGNFEQSISLRFLLSPPTLFLSLYYYLYLYFPAVSILVRHI
jgi:hypothetical protein